MTMDVLPKVKLRRVIAVALIVVGTLMLFLVPNTSGGWLLLALGVVIETLGLVLRHGDSRSSCRPDATDDVTREAGHINRRD